MKANIIDKFGLTPTELAYIEEQAVTMDFDFIRFADEITITISAHTPCAGEKWRPEFDVLIEGVSEDERGNGYFGYGTTRELLH